MAFSAGVGEIRTILHQDTLWLLEPGILQNNEMFCLC